MDDILNRIKGENRIRNGYILAFALLLFSYLLSLYTNRQLLNQVSRMEHTNKVINNLEIMLSYVKDAETGVRGYFITKKQDFLAPYVGSHHKADSIFQIIAEETTDNPTNLENLDLIKNTLDKRFILLKNSLHFFETNNYSVTDSLQLLQAEAKTVMDKLRMEVSQLQWGENIILKERGAKMKSSLKTLNAITSISLFVAFSLLIFGFITYFRERKAKNQAMEETKNYQSELNDRITELNKANEELKQMRSQEKFAATGRIARTIAHEVRNPLTNINLAVDQLQAESVKDENTQFLFDMISRNSNRINMLISDLLNSTKFSELNYGKISINELLDEALLEAQDRINLHNITLVKKYSEDICEVSVDRVKIKIAFLNVIINSIEAMESRKERNLTLETKSENDKCQVIISDTGCGMNEESLSRLFEPYFTSKQKGNGLGLTNTQNIILNHKGNISVVSKEGNGTKFYIVLSF